MHPWPVSIKKERRLNESKAGDDTSTSHTEHLKQRGKPEKGTEKYMNDQKHKRIKRKDLQRVKQASYEEKRNKIIES